MNSLSRFKYKFVFWTEAGDRHGGHGRILGTNKIDAARRAKSKLSKDLDLPPADINITEIKKV